MSNQPVFTMIIIRRVFLVMTAVACLLLCYESNSERWQQQPARQDAVILSATSGQTCRALFTITAVHHNHSLNEVYSSPNSVSNGTHSGGLSREEWRADGSVVNYFSRGGSSSAASSVRHLLRKRNSPSGAFTTQYYSLAALLPKVLLFSDGQSDEKINYTKYANNKEYQGKWKEKDNKSKPPFFVGESRVSVGGGQLPHVPCTLAPYDDPTSFITCVKRRLEGTPSLWLCFMGDSKIRNLYNEFLSRTDSELRYTVKIMNRNMSWPEAEKLQLSPVWIDMEASTEAAPRLRITYRFRKFSEMKSKLFSSTPELVELNRWATGAEPTPDLLVVGYTSWMMQWREVWNEEENHYPLDILDFLLQMHKVVVPLLEQIGQRTRVLVLPQSRLRPHSYSTPNVMAAFNPTNFDWSEMTFGYLLRQYRASQASRRAPRHLHWDNNSETYEATTPVNDPRPYGANEQTIMTQQDHPRSPAATVQATTPRDHLIPSRSTSGLWWWDSSLPLNLAGILDCDELHRRGLTSHSAFRNRLLYCLDSQHAGTITNTDLVTMLFNLICNSYLDLHHSNCCS